MYKCPECQKQYTKWGGLQSHLKNKHGYGFDNQRVYTKLGEPWSGFSIESAKRNWVVEKPKKKKKKYFDVLNHPLTLRGGHWESNRRRH